MDTQLINSIEKLYSKNDIDDKSLKLIIENEDKDIDEILAHKARLTAQKFYGKKVYLRGLIEFTNYCKNNCYYCGIRSDSKETVRYRLSKEEILDCCAKGYSLDFRTFVLQGGEDPHYTDDMVCDIVYSIRNKFPDCAVTLSIGEKSYESYKKYFDAGAQRYLLRHETANPIHYAKLHPKNLSFDNRKKCLYNLKKIGYQVGCGIMVGSPYQTIEDIISDLRFMQELKPQMIGIGPFIPSQSTHFSEFKSGTLTGTLRLLSIIRLMFPDVLLPATTALGTISPKGREQGILSGANVVMPNLSPVGVRAKYLLYDGKICTGDEAEHCRYCMQRRIESVGYKISVSRGDHVNFKDK